MPDHASNPAGRLWLYLDYLVHRPESDGVHPHAAAYFGLPAGNSDRYLTAMAAVLRLPDEIERLVLDLDDPPIPAQKLLNPLGAARSLLNGDPLGTSKIARVKQTMNPAMLTELDSTSHILNRYSPTVAGVSPDSLDQIKQLAHEIIALALEDATLDDQTRSAFVRYAYRIVEAADLVKITGPQPLLDELDRFHQETRRLKTPPGAQLWDATKRLTAAIVLAVEVFMIPVNVDNALEYYGDAFQRPALTVAPGQPLPEIVIGPDGDVEGRA